MGPITDYYFGIMFLLGVLVFYGATYLRVLIIYIKTKVNHYNFEESKDKGFIILFLIGVINLFYPDYLKYFGKISIVLPQKISVYLGLLGCIGSILSIFFLIKAQNSLGSSWKIGLEKERKAKLVTNGLYRYCRHPIYFAMFLFFTSLFLLLPTALTLIILVGNALALIMTAKKEEEHLINESGEDYKKYMKKTSFLIPKLNFFKLMQLKILYKKRAVKNKGNYVKKVLLSLSSIILLLLVIELVSRISYPVYSNYNTEMWRYSRELKIKSRYPLLSHEHAPNSEALLYGVNISINSKGWRGDEFDSKKENATYRILMVGDSITLGWGIEENATFSKIIEEKLNENRPLDDFNEYEVINMGVGNYNTQMEYAVLKEKGINYDPNLIIVNYYLNDLESTPNIEFEGIKGNSYFYAFMWNIVTNIKYRFFNDNYETYYLTQFDDKSKRERNKDSIINIIKLCKENNIRLIFIIHPEYHNFKDYRFQDITDFVCRMVESYHIACRDLLPYFMDTEPKDIWINEEDVHPNELGHQIIADAIYENILNNSP